MDKAHSFFNDGHKRYIKEIQTHAERQHYNQNEQVFREGEKSDAFFIIETGAVSIHCDDEGKKKLLCCLGPGDYFGEMGIINQDKRSATASTTARSTLLKINREKFLEISRTHPDLMEKIGGSLAQRNKELILRESLADATGIRSKKIYVSIKGDPSLRETALFRQRYESPVDKIITLLMPNLEELLLNRCTYKLTVNYNSGEIRARSVFDPFRDKVHTSDRLIDHAYIARHFMKISYEDKLDLIMKIHDFIASQPQFEQLPEHWKSIFAQSREQWDPLGRSEIINIISKLSELRSVPEFYLRNFSVGILQDAIRLQFNCDGTHIVSTEDYQQFIKSNFEL
jgi:CRP-like cAMP-binding protein